MTRPKSEAEALEIGVETRIASSRIRGSRLNCPGIRHRPSDPCLPQWRFQTNSHRQPCICSCTLPQQLLSMMYHTAQFCQAESINLRKNVVLSGSSSVQLLLTPVKQMYHRSRDILDRTTRIETVNVGSRKMDRRQICRDWQTTRIFELLGDSKTQWPTPTLQTHLRRNHLCKIRRQ